MNRLDWNIERYRTRDLLYQENSLMIADYPSYTIQKGQILDQMYEIAKDNGYNGERADFLSQYINGLNNGAVQKGTLNTFPIPGNTFNVYLDTETSILYHYYTTTENIDVNLYNNDKIRIVDIMENNVLTHHLYIPVTSFGLTQ